MHDSKKSKFRSKFKLSPSDKKYLQIKGLATIREHGYLFIKERIAPANPKNDGQHPPMKNHPIFIAQHATPTCCRGCIQKWHNIPKGTALNNDQVRYLVDEIIMKWIVAYN